MYATHTNLNSLLSFSARHEVLTKEHEGDCGDGRRTAGVLTRQSPGLLLHALHPERGDLVDWVGFHFSLLKGCPQLSQFGFCCLLFNPFT